MDDSRLEAQQKPLSETEMTSDSTSPQQQPSDISPGVYPAPLQTASSSETRSRSRTGSSSLRLEAEPRLAEPSAVSSSGHERMPSVNSLPPKDGHFGVVSSSGQLVCEFRVPPAGTGEAPILPPKAPEEFITLASFATTSERIPRAESASPPPQHTNQQSTAPYLSSTSIGPTASTLELAVDHSSYPEAVDRNNYPEVYIPAEGQQKADEEAPHLPPRTTTGSPPIPRKSLPMESTASSLSSPPAPAYSTPADYQRIGYQGTLDMSTAVATVTPLHMLGDQPDTVDCPFCQRRVETAVKKKASSKTHMWGAILFFSTFLGVAAPYCCDWYVNVEHYCKNCQRKVAQKKFDSTETEALGTRPEHRQVSYFQPAEEPVKKKFRS